MSDRESQSFLQVNTKNSFKGLTLNICFFINAIGSSSVIPMLTFFLLEKTITTQEVLIIGSAKFWVFTVCSPICAGFVNKIQINHCLTISLLLKGLAFSILCFNQSLLACMIAILFNGFGAALFSIASSLYVQHTADNVSESFALRFTIQNVGAAISPLLIGACAYVGFGIVPFASTLGVAFAAGTFLSTKMQNFTVQEHASCINDTPALREKWLVLLFVGGTSLLFSMFYYLFETTLPLNLEKNKEMAWFPILMGFNSASIILLQIKANRYISERLGHENALLVALGICTLLSLPVLLDQEKSIPSFICFVIGITYLEMFYSSGLDTVIAKQTSGKLSTYMYSASGLFLALGTTLAGALYAYKATTLIAIALLLLALTSVSKLVFTQQLNWLSFIQNRNSK